MFRLGAASIQRPVSKNSTVMVGISGAAVVDWCRRRVKRLLDLGSANFGMLFHEMISVPQDHSNPPPQAMPLTAEIIGL